MQRSTENHLTVLYDFQYTAKDKRLITVKQGERLYLINKTNADWWQVIRSCEERPFFVPAQYVTERKKVNDDEVAEYQNLKFLKREDSDNTLPGKPIPKVRTQIKKTIKENVEAPVNDKRGRDKSTDSSAQTDRSSIASRASIGDNNRMKNSYNLSGAKSSESGSKIERKQSVPLNKRKPLELNKTMSRSLEKLAQEIRFEPRSSQTKDGNNSENVNVPILESNERVLRVNSERKMDVDKKGERKTEERGIFRSSLRGKSKDVDVILNDRGIPDAKQKNPRLESLRGRTSDAAVVLNERKPVAKHRSLFSSFKRKKQAFVLSSSWEGLDKIVEQAEKPLVSPMGLQRSRTFMYPEKVKPPRTRLDAYVDTKWTFTTFKSAENQNAQPATKSPPAAGPSDLDINNGEKTSPVNNNQRQNSVESILSSGGCESDGPVGRKAGQPFGTRKASLVRNRRVDSSKGRLRVPASPPPDASPLRDLGEGWGEFHSSEGRPFYYNRLTGERNLKPPRKGSNMQLTGSKDSICSDLPSPSRSSPSPSPKFSSQTSLDSIDPPRFPFRPSLSRLTPIDIPPLPPPSDQTSPRTIPGQPTDRFLPLDNSPSDGEALELSDHVVRREVVPDGWEETSEVCKDTGSKKRVFVHPRTKERWYAAQDDGGNLYFYQKNSNVSAWRLPDRSQDDEQEEIFGLHRSATESAIPQEEPRLRRNGDKDTTARSSRATKTQSMIEECKTDLTRNNVMTASMPPTESLGEEMLRHGPLNRAKICENGKPKKKIWVNTYAVLTPTTLHFYKDVKTFNLKHQAAGVYAAHSLAGAIIEPGGKISAKKNVYKITCFGPDAEILIQTDKKIEADEWRDKILEAVSNLKSRQPSIVEPPSPIKNIKPKFVKAKVKGNGSVEDLSSPGGDSKSKISELLKKFILRRPSSDSLRQKGILKDEPVFGCTLEQITLNRQPRIPSFVERCIKVIESSEENMKTDGLYRASGNLSQVQKIRLQVDQNNLDIIDNEEDVHVLAGSLKLFFRELKEPLIPSPLFKQVLEASRNNNKKEKLKELKDIMKKLPIPNRDTLKFLLEHLLRVQEQKEFNRMHIPNLAIVFGPTLMWPEEESTNMALDLMQQNLVIECLLMEFHNVFPPA